VQPQRRDADRDARGDALNAARSLFSTWRPLRRARKAREGATRGRDSGSSWRPGRRKKYVPRRPSRVDEAPERHRDAYPEEGQGQIASATRTISNWGEALVAADEGRLTYPAASTATRAQADQRAIARELKRGEEGAVA